MCVMCCSVLQCVAVCCHVCHMTFPYACHCCSVLQYVAVCCSVLPGVSHDVSLRVSLLQCVAVRVT